MAELIYGWDGNGYVTVVLSKGQSLPSRGHWAGSEELGYIILECTNSN